MSKSDVECHPQGAISMPMLQISNENGNPADVEDSQVVRRRVSLKTRALRSHRSLLKQLTLRSDKKFMIEVYEEKELFAVVLDLVLHELVLSDLEKRRKRQQNDLSNGLQGYDVTSSSVESKLANYHSDMQLLSRTYIMDQEFFESVRRFVKDFIGRRREQLEISICDGYKSVSRSTRDEGKKMVEGCEEAHVEENCTNAERKRLGYSWTEMRNLVSLDVRALLEEELQMKRKQDGTSPEQDTNTIAQPFQFVDMFLSEGGRNGMEDRLTNINNVCAYLGNSVLLENHCMSYFGVFDGHAGLTASVYVRMFLHHNIFANLRERFHGATILGENDEQLLDSSMANAMIQAFEKTDEDFLNHSKSVMLNAGTTVLVAVLTQNLVTRRRRIHVAFVGDSQAMVYNEERRSTTIIGCPHNAENASERDRIEQSGGSVYHFFGQARVNGVLAVTRALGDASQKDHIIPTPEVFHVDINDNDAFIVLGSDGLFESLTPENISSTIVQEMSHPFYSSCEGRIGHGDGCDISRKLIATAMDRNVKDNISACIIFL